jgi:MFS transporter, SP family, xylose:H+ symportor
MYMSQKSIYYSIISALCGLLFGFDTAVISGANLPLKALWGTSEWFHGFFIISVVLWGTLVGAILGNFPCDALGRKNTLFWIGVLFFISALGTALATDPFVFSFYRFIGGLAIGTSTIAAPTYISEIAPEQFRGRLVGFFQINIVTGILLAYISNYLISDFGGSNNWRFMLGVEAIPALAFLLLVVNIPESPRWLIIWKKNEVKALEVLRVIFGNDQVSPQNIINNIKTEQNDLKFPKDPIQKNKNAFILAFFIAFFNQVSGINFILYYSPEIMEKAGFATEESLLSAIFIGVVNLIFTFWGISLIDKMGRKYLMLIGSTGYLIGLSLIIYGFYYPSSPSLNLLGILTFIAAHAIGQGTVIWVFISEIFNNSQRAKGQSFGAGVHWAMASIITLFGSALINYLEPWLIFFAFLVFMCFQMLFAIFIMPETKGIPLERIRLKT